MKGWLISPPSCLACYPPENLPDRRPGPLLDCVTWVLRLSRHVCVSTELCTSQVGEEAILHPCI